MKTEWMGRYRGIIQALVKHTNYHVHITNTRLEVKDGIFLNAVEWQVLEYLYEYEDSCDSMNSMSAVLGIPQSSFSYISKRLCDYGLVQRFRMSNNKKNVILKITEKGKDLYEYNVTQHMQQLFAPMFEALKDVPDKYLAAFEQAMYSLNHTEEKEVEMVPENNRS